MELPDDEQRLIVELFAERQPFYDAPAVYRLTGATPGRLEAALADGEIGPLTDGGSLRFRWEDVANLALKRWTPRQIARTLEREGYADALAPLNHVLTITVELPIYQIRLLQHLAEQKGKEDGAPRTISDILEYEIAAMAADNVAEMEERFPGFSDAAVFPK